MSNKAEIVITEQKTCGGQGATCYIKAVIRFESWEQYLDFLKNTRTVELSWDEKKAELKSIDSF